ncbi:MAG: DUF3800 domain-containing protein [Candidatus Melainabacteria bacterium]|nr:DUF3800 domain-containing protein [Candidatus Melainabacteria bacterium]
MVQKVKEGKVSFFVDESGDAVFFNKYGKLIVGQEGCSKILLIGFIETTKPSLIRCSITNLLEEIKKDSYLSMFCSFKETINKGFHAKDDRPEIRERMFKLIKGLDFRCQIIIARKNKDRFLNNRFEGKPDKFYDYLVTRLFERSLHRYTENDIFFSKRGSSERLDHLRHAINLAVSSFNQKWNVESQAKIKVTIQKSSQEPCLQIIDYMNWAIYRAITTNDYNYLEFIKEKYSLIWDIFDSKNAGKENGWKNIYTKDKNPFHPQKMSPL